MTELRLTLLCNSCRENSNFGLRDILKGRKSSAAEIVGEILRADQL